MTADMTAPQEAESLKYCLFDSGGTLILRYNLDRYYSSEKGKVSHSFPVMKLGVITEGEADWRFIGGVSHTVPGDIVVLRPNSPRVVENITGDHLSCDMFSFILPAVSSNDRCVELFYSESSTAPNVLSHEHESSEEVRELLNEIVCELDSDEPFCCDMVLSLLRQAVVKICRAFGMRMSGGYHTVSRYTDRHFETERFDRENARFRHDDEKTISFVIAGVTDYIKNSFEGPIDVDSLAGMTHMSRSTFFRHFRAQTGMTVNRYIQRCRVEKVIERLSDSGGNILDAALGCGFSSSSGFYAAFRSVTGMSPREFLAEGYTLREKAEIRSK